MTELILIRHAQVTVEPAVPNDQWRLSDIGQESLAALRQHPELSGVRRFYSSPEPKAVATAEALAAGRELVVVPDLREVDRRVAGWVASEDEYAALVAEILGDPMRSARGCEPAEAARKRVMAAIDGLVVENDAAPIAVVSHGIVLTLYLSWLRGLARPDPDLWRRIRFPDLAVVEPGDRRIMRDLGE